MVLALCRRRVGRFVRLRLLDVIGTPCRRPLVGARPCARRPQAAARLGRWGFVRGAKVLV